jgi:hypothetical protein
MRYSVLFTLMAVIATTFESCDRMVSLSFDPGIPGYTQSPDRTILLKKALREISGIHDLNETELLGINDEDGTLFFINKVTGRFREQTFGKQGDYEDLAITPYGYYILASNGDLHHVDRSSGKETAVYSRSFPKFVEFESLCYDKKHDQLLLICKSCGPNDPYINAWRFDPKTNSFDPNPVFSIPWTEIRKKGKDDTIECLPSAAAIHPVTGRLFIIASMGKVMLQSTVSGELEAVYGINPDIFQQPEGLCFAPDGDMYITNEGRQSKASLLYYPYKR